ncbi:MAG: Alpha/beta hydrolase [Xanthobacteraceae bacterium]|nr:Alpha/beta hydrolase [Xanthobacteraceae bacterium]
MTVLKWLLLLGLCGYGAVVLLVYVAQRTILYPSPDPARMSPEQAGFPQAQEIVLDRPDGAKIILWHVPPRDGKKIALFFHGNGEVLAWRVPRFRELTADGTGLVALSFRGYGGSTGRPSEAALIEDGAATYAFAAERYPTNRIVPWGYSLGSGVAVAIAASQPVNRLVLEAPYSSTVDVAAAVFWYLPVRWLMKDTFRSDLRIAQVKVPLLVLHGARDGVVPMRFGERLYAQANEPKRMVRFPDAGHTDLDAYGAMAVARQFLGE